MEITDNKILLDYSDLTLTYNTVNPSCGGRCGEAICIRPKKQKQTLSQRVAKRNLDKDVMRQTVRKKQPEDGGSFTDTRPAKSSRAGSRRIWRGGES